MPDTIYLSLLLATMITGFSKFSVGGMGIIILPVLMLSFSGHEALGIILPIYLLTDLMAVLTYNKHVKWHIILQVLPIAFIGMGIGFCLLLVTDANGYALMVGLIILAMVLLGIWLERNQSGFMETQTAKYVASLLSGIVGIIANAAGPVMSLYLVEKKLSKNEIVHTRVWAMFILNLAKIPTLFSLGVLNMESLNLSIQGLPGLIIGIAAGYTILKYINLSHLKWAIRSVALLAAIKLLLF